MEQSRNLNKERNIVKEYWRRDLTKDEVQTVQGVPRVESIKVNNLLNGSEMEYNEV